MCKGLFEIFSQLFLLGDIHMEFCRKIHVNNGYAGPGHFMPTFKVQYKQHEVYHFRKKLYVDSAFYAHFKSPVQAT